MKSISIIYSSPDTLSGKMAELIFCRLNNSGYPVRLVDCAKEKIPSQAVFHILVINSPAAQFMAGAMNEFKLQGPVTAIRFLTPDEKAVPWSALSSLTPVYEVFIKTDPAFIDSLSSGIPWIRAQAESALTQIVTALLNNMRAKSPAVRFKLDLGRLGGFLLNLLYNLLGNRFLGKAFGTGAGCDSCGQCVSACPNKVLTLRGGVPRWNMRCKGCLTCRDLCPRRAIGISLVRLAVFTVGAFLPYDEWLFLFLGHSYDFLTVPDISKGLAIWNGGFALFGVTIRNIVIGLLIWSGGFALFCVAADFLLSFLERFGAIRKFFGIFLSQRRPVLWAEKLKAVRARALTRQ